MSKICFRAYSIWLSCLFSLFLISCGSPSYETQAVLDYRVFLTGGNDQMREAIYELNDVYTEELGFEAISFVNSEDDANSIISFPSSWTQGKNVLGFGKWEAWVVEEGKDFVSLGRPLDRTVSFSMKLEFEVGNFKRQLERHKNGEAGAWAHLYHLYAHELGHGFQLEHEDIKRSVMFEVITENSRPDVDYPSYFEHVKRFFNGGANLEF